MRSYDITDTCRLHAPCTTPRSIPLLCFLLLMSVLASSNTSLSQQLSGERGERARRMSKEAEDRGLAEPFQGVTTDGDVNLTS
jgi:hypothetical protein